MVDVGRLHVLTRSVSGDPGEHLALARAALEGGADAIQYREKRAADSATSGLLDTLRRLTAQYGARLIINDDVALAKLHGVGVHLGITDEDPCRARKVLGLSVCIGWTVHDQDEARRSRDLPIDYVGVGPVFGSTTKPSAGAPLGLAGLSAIAEIVRVPVVAIGNIRLESVTAVLDAGAQGIAVGAAVSAATDPCAVTRALSATMGTQGR